MRSCYKSSLSCLRILVDLVLCQRYFARGGIEVTVWETYVTCKSPYATVMLNYLRLEKSIVYALDLWMRYAAKKRKLPLDVDVFLVPEYTAYMCRKVES